MGLVQSTSATGTSHTTLSLSLSNPTTAGNCLVVCVGALDDLSTNPRVSKITLGGSTDNFTAAATAYNDNSVNNAIWIDPDCAGGKNTIAITFDHDTSYDYPGTGAWVMEWSGVSVSSPLDETSSATSSGTAWSSGSTGTLTQTSEVAIGSITTGNPSTATLNTPGSPWTELGAIALRGEYTSQKLAAGYQVVSTSSALQYNGSMPSAGDYSATIITLTMPESVSVIGATGKITLAAPAGIVAVGPAGTLGAITVAAPAGAPVTSGAWVVFGNAGIITAAALPGSISVGPAGTPGQVTLAAPAGSLTVHVIAPAPVTPPAAFTATVRRAPAPRARTGPRHVALPRQGLTQYSAMQAVQAPPMITWDVYRHVTVSASMAWNVREQVIVPDVENTPEIEVLPVWGLPAPGTLPMIGWNIRQGVTAQTSLQTTYTRAGRRTGHHTPSRRLGLRGGGQVQRSAALQASGPTIAWHDYGQVTAPAPAAWRVLRQVTVRAYTAWYTASNHGVVNVLAVATWNTQDITVTVTATATWDTRALVGPQATVTWTTYGHLAVTAGAAWNILHQVYRAAYTITRRRTAAPPQRQRRGIPLRPGRADSSMMQLQPGTDAALIRWNVYNPVTVTAIATWDTQGHLHASASMTWETRHTDAAGPAIATWHLDVTLAVTKTLTWNVRNPVTVTATITWETLHAVTQARTYLTAREAVTRPGRRGIPRRGGAAWTQVRGVGPSCLAIASWAVNHQVNAVATASWDTIQTTSSRTAIIHWDINPTINVQATIDWRVLQQIQAVTHGTEYLRYDHQQHAAPARAGRKLPAGMRTARAAGSAFLPAGTATPGIGWDTRQTRPSGTAIAAWDLIGTLHPVCTITWNLRNPVTVQTPSIQWNVGQPLQGGMRMASMDEWFTPE